MYVFVCGFSFIHHSFLFVLSTWGVLYFGKSKPKWRENGVQNAPERVKPGNKTSTFAS